MAAPAQRAFGYLPGKPREPVGGIGVAVCHNGVIGLEHKAEIVQLIGKRALAALRSLKQLFGAHASGLELVYLRKQHCLKLRSAPCGGIDPQP